MKTSLILAASGALMASASPVLQDRRLHITTKVVEEWVTVTVTAGDVPFATANAFHQHGPGRPMYTAPVRPQEPSTTVVQPTSQAPAPVPSPSSSSIVVVAPPPAPETTSSTVIVVPVSSSTKQPEPTTAPAVVAAPPAATSTKQEPATTKVDSPAAPGASDYASTLLYHHNIHRSNHSAGALEWGDSYAQYAQQAAAPCKFQHDLTPGGGGYGQNIAMWGSTNKQTVQDVGAAKAGAQATTNMWYNGELPLWPASDYGKENPDMTKFEDWGHFSQLVWKESKQLGCHTQFCPQGTMSQQMDVWYTVCNYYPAGNMGGGYGKNVAPPLSQARVVA